MNGLTEDMKLPLLIRKFMPKIFYYSVEIKIIFLVKDIIQAYPCIAWRTP
jgi:hypothetical protein